MEWKEGPPRRPGPGPVSPPSLLQVQEVEKQRTLRTRRPRPSFPPLHHSRLMNKRHLPFLFAGRRRVIAIATAELTSLTESVRVLFSALVKF